MTREEFEAEVRRLETFARQYPLSYRRRVARLIWLGHGLVYAMLGLCLLLGAGLLWLLFSGGLGSAIGFLAVTLLVLPLGGAILLIIQSLNVRLQPPRGLHLTRETAQTLYDAVDSLSATVGSPRVHHIVLVAEATAAMVQMPLLGLFGWYRNTLVVGLPLMQAMSVPQFSAVIAHEMAHLRGRHGQLGAWVYRTERVWSGLLSSFETQRKVGSGLLRRILAWYVPKLNAYTFVLRREDEYEADRLAAKILGAAATGEALMVSHLVHGFLSEHFWPKVQKLAGETPDAPPGLFALMGRLLPRVGAASDAYKWLRRGLMLETDVGHAPLPGRAPGGAGAIGQRSVHLESAWNSQPPAPPRLTAAQQYMGRSLERASAELELAWREEVARNWRIAYAEGREGRRRLLALNKKAEYGHLDDEEAVDQCLLTERLVGAAQAIPLAEHLVGCHPSVPPLRFHLGRLKLEAGDCGGIALIEAAMAKDPELVYQGCELIHAHLRQAGKAAEAMQYVRRAERHYAAVRGALRERDGVNDSDEFEAHGLGGDLVCYLRERVQEVSDIQEAYLVRKRVRHLADQPMIVLAVAPRKVSMLERWHHQEIEELLTQKIRQFPHEVFLVRFDRCPKSLPAKIRRVKGARICPMMPK